MKVLYYWCNIIAIHTMTEYCTVDGLVHLSLNVLYIQYIISFNTNPLGFQKQN